VKKHNHLTPLVFSTLIYLCTASPSLAQTLCFSPPNLHFAGAGNGIAGAVADDLNNDGLIDLVTSNGTGNNISIMLGDGNGNFSFPVNYPTGTVSSGMNKGDFNNDGELDLVVTNQGGGNISVLLGNGDGTFNSAVNTPLSCGTPAIVVCHDFDNDGILDVVVGCTSGDLIILKGDGTGNFSVLNTYYSGSSLMASIELADFNNDGILDIAVPGGLVYGIIFLPGLGGGNFGAPILVPCNERPFYLISTDLNNDMLPDIIVASLDTTITVFLNTGNFSLAPPVYYGNIPSIWGTSFVALADFNNDSIDDILVGYGTTNGFSVLPGLTNGSFANAQHFWGASQSVLAIAVDLNQDNKLDVIDFSLGTASYYVMFNCMPTSMAEVPNQNANVKIYPTIVSEFINIEISNINLLSSHTEISIYDLGGKLVWTYSNIKLEKINDDSYSIRLDWPSLPAGNYYINIITALIKEKERRYVLNGKILVI
jgi:hypothetical protein